MQSNNIEFSSITPCKELSNYVESFWMITNRSKKDHKIIILPDGRFDIIFSKINNDYFRITLKSLDTEPQQATIPPNSVFFAISFKLLAIEYLLQIKFESIINKGINLPFGFWDITDKDLLNFDFFVNKTTASMLPLIKKNVDKRKHNLFELIYNSNGTMPVKELSEKVSWSSRQINRYFHKTFGISLKSYCNIFRFKSSLSHIKTGNLYPQLNFTDQAHFIKEVKKMSGVTPKELSKNINNRFILLSAIT